MRQLLGHHAVTLSMAWFVECAGCPFLVQFLASPSAVKQMSAVALLIRRRRMLEICQSDAFAKTESQRHARILVERLVHSESLSGVVFSGPGSPWLRGVAQEALRSVLQEDVAAFNNGMMDALVTAAGNEGTIAVLASLFDFEGDCNWPAVQQLSGVDLQRTQAFTRIGTIAKSKVELAVETSNVDLLARCLRLMQCIFEPNTGKVAAGFIAKLQ